MVLGCVANFHLVACKMQLLAPEQALLGMFWRGFDTGRNRQERAVHGADLSFSDVLSENYWLLTKHSAMHALPKSLHLTGYQVEIGYSRRGKRVCWQTLE